MTDPIETRRQQLEADLRAEGWPEDHIASRATPELAERMLRHEKDVVAQIASLFGGAA